MLRISTTTLESFRLFSQPDQEWMTEDALLATIRGEFTPTPAINLGLAFGRVLEQPERFRVPNGYRCDDYTFDDATMSRPLALFDRSGVFEAKATKVYGDAVVVAKADYLHGLHCREFKTTTGSFDVEKYAESCQWRFLLDIFEAALVTYDVFLLEDHDNGVATLRGIESFNLFPYAELRLDCQELVGEFVSYVTVKGLDGLLRERQRRAEAA